MVRQVICPFILDQFYWAERMFWLGVASEPLNSSCLFPEKDGISKAADALVQAIDHALSPDVKFCATEMANRISAEVSSAPSFLFICRILSKMMLVHIANMNKNLPFYSTNTPTKY